MPDLERRKQVRVRLRPDLAVVTETIEGRTGFVVKDPISLRYYRFREREHFLAQCMDGRPTLEEVRFQYEARFRPDRLSLEEVESFARMLITAGLAQADAAPAGARLFNQGQTARRRRRRRTLASILAIRIPLFDPDRLLARILGPLQWVYTATFIVSSMVLIGAALLLVMTHLDTFCSRLPAFHEFFQWQTVLGLWMALGVVKVIHELGHGLTSKAFGGEVHETGLLLLCLFPCLYCDVTDAWTLPSKWRRMAVGFAGIYVELIIAAIAAFGWWVTSAHLPLNHLCLCLMIVCGINTVFFNANPLMQFDGYHVLADWLEVPNLRQRAARSLGNVILTIVLGATPQPVPVSSPWRRGFLVCYGIASGLYRFAVLVGVLWFLNTFLDQYRLGALGSLLALLALGSMLVGPLSQVSQVLRRGGANSVKPVRVTLSAAIVAALVLAFFLAPVPLGHVRQTALVQLAPDVAEKVYVSEPAILERLWVQDGQEVQVNDLLAEFRSLDLETQLEEARSGYDVRTVQHQALSEQLAAADARDRPVIEVGLATVAGERDALAQEIEVLRARLNRLVLRAPRSGVVVNPPKADEVGRFWQRGESAFCQVGDPTRRRALLPVSPGEYLLLKEDLGNSNELAASIRVPGGGNRTRSATIRQLPESEAREVPFGLSQRGGGPLAVEPGSSDRSIPQTQQYLVALDLSPNEGLLPPGSLVQAKVHCRWRPCAWRLWWELASTFR